MNIADNLTLPEVDILECETTLSRECLDDDTGFDLDESVLAFQAE